MSSTNKPLFKRPRGCPIRPTNYFAAEQMGLRIDNLLLGGCINTRQHAFLKQLLNEELIEDLLEVHEAHGAHYVMVKLAELKIAIEL